MFSFLLVFFFIYPIKSWNIKKVITPPLIISSLLFNDIQPIKNLRIKQNNGIIFYPMEKKFDMMLLIISAGGHLK